MDGRDRTTAMLTDSRFRSRAVTALLAAGLSTFSACATSRLPAEHRVFEVRSARSGLWSDAETWQPRRPRAGDRVLVQAGHRVTYDVKGAGAIRSIAVAGTLTFARDRDTELNVGVVTIYGAGQEIVADDPGVADVHDHHPPSAEGGGVLEVGTPAQPIPVPHTARIRLHYLEGMDAETAPALVCRPGGRMDFHGAPIDRTWLKLDEPAEPGDTSVTVKETPNGWRVGDEILVTGSTHAYSPHGFRHDTGYVGTEKRRITSVDGRTLTLDEPLEVEHYGSGPYRSEVANLSRTVVVESADPAGLAYSSLLPGFSFRAIPADASERRISCAA